MSGLRANSRSCQPTILVGPSLHLPEGLSMAFDTLVRGFRQQGLPFLVVNTGSNRAATRVSGTFTLQRAAEVVISLLKYWGSLFRARRVYITIGFSKVSLLRDLLMIWPACLFGRRLVLHVHTGAYGEFFAEQPEWVQGLIRATLRRADAIIVLGDLLRAQFSFLPNAEKLLHVVPNGLPLDLKVDHPPAKSLTAKEPLRLLYLSNMLESKGYLDCLESCRILAKEKGIPVRLDFCGRFVQHRLESAWNSEEEARRNFLQKIESQGLRGIAHYQGVVHGEAKRRLLEESHVLILPTAYAWEGQPISIIEALAFGMPVIATRYRGIPEQVIDGYNGFLVEAKNPRQIAARLEFLWQAPEEYQRLSGNARRHFRQRFTPRAHLDLLIPLILGTDGYGIKG